MSGIRTELVGGTAVVTLARPPVNALDLELVVELRHTFEQYAASPPEGLVLTHDGPAFCAGVDTKAVPTYSHHQRRSMAAEINAMITALYGLPKATVAAIGGHAIGAGFVLMLACDIRLSLGAGIKLALSEVTAGVPYPAGPLEVVRAELSPAQQRQLVLTGDDITPADALREGILDETHPPDDLLLRALELARIRSGASAYTEVKRQLRASTLERMRALVAAGAEPW